MQHAEFADRNEAAIRLADVMAQSTKITPDTMLLGLVRGGAVIASELAAQLSLAWDVYVVRKIGAPSQPEYAVGAMCECGTFVFNHDALHYFELDNNWQSGAIAAAQSSCDELKNTLREGEPTAQITDRDVIVCDDGMATGLSMQVAIEGIRSCGAKSVSVAVPVLSTDALSLLAEMDVTAYYVGCPLDFRAVGIYYHDFRSVEISVVMRLLAARETIESE